MDIKTLTGLPVSDQQELLRIARDLSYVAVDGTQDYVNALIEHLVLHTLAQIIAKSHQGARHTRDIAAKLRTLIGFSIDYELLLAALRRLEETGKVYTADGEHDETARFGIELETAKDLSKKYQEYEDSEKKIIDDWLEEIRSRHEGLDNSMLDALREDLITFSLSLYSQHSIESVSLYWGDDENVRTLLDQMDYTSIEQILPNRGEVLNTIRAVEIPRFFKHAPLDRKIYIGRQLNPYFALQMMYLDSKCAAFLSQHITGGTLFLDTNFLYRVVGLNGGPELHLASLKLLELSKKLGYVAVVSPRTIEEYKISVEGFMRRARSLPKIDPDIAIAALYATSEEDFYTYYWRRSAKTQGHFTTETDLKFYKQIEVLLQEYGIPIETQYDKEISRRKAELSHEMSMIEYALDGYIPAHEDILEHDAHMRLLILLFRQGHEKTNSPLEIPYWLLTCDTKLVKYDRIIRPRNGLKVPYCLLSSQWMQLLSPFNSLLDNFQVIHAETLESPLFRLFNPPPPSTVQDLIDFMKTTEGYPPHATAKIVADEIFVHRFARIKDPEERDKLFENYFYGQLVESLENDIDKLKKKLQATEANQQLTIAEKDELQKRIANLLADVQTLQEKASETETLRGKVAELDALSEELDKLRTQAIELQMLRDQVNTLREQEIGSKKTGQEQSEIIQRLQAELGQERRKGQEQESRVKGLEDYVQAQYRRESTEKERRQFILKWLGILAALLTAAIVLSAVILTFFAEMNAVLPLAILICLILWVWLVDKRGAMSSTTSDWWLFNHLHRLKRYIFLVLGGAATILSGLVISGLWDIVKQWEWVKAIVGG